MGHCRDCIYYDYEGVDYKRDCYVHNWCSNFKMKVDPNATCNKFVEKATPSNSGYTGGNSGGCFLTSACVEYMGKADDCEELTVLRSFRDNYLKDTTEGNELVEQYYEVAPKIVEHINVSEKKERYYKYIYSVVTNCIKLISENNYGAALSEYKNMVAGLKKEFSC